MTGQHKMVKALPKLKRSATVEESAEHLGAEGAGLKIQPEAGHEPKGRRAGKRSDPAYRPTTIFVRKETQRRATRLLEDQDLGRDFSDLIEELVSEWITKQSSL